MSMFSTSRLLTIFIAAAALIILSPLLLIISVILKYSGEGEILYKQLRCGLNDERFYVLKFATMLKNSESMGAGLLTVENDPRVLPFGRWLRATKINELPQLINLLRGDMDIVGPRPLVPDGDAQYSEIDRKKN